MATKNRREEFLSKELTPRQKVLAWLDRIGELDPAEREAVLGACKNGYFGHIDGIAYTGQEVRTYYLSRYQ